MLTQAPLPNWLDLYRALMRKPPDDTRLAASWHCEGEVAGLLSCSAWSLALIALWRQSCGPRSLITVWIPDFFCNASLVALRQTGARLVFYPLSETLAPDLAACRGLAEGDLPDIFALVHYFGRPTPTADVRGFCARHGAWLIEDAAHVLHPVAGVGSAGDFVLYSPHKHIPIPDGAVLVVRTDGPSRFTSDEISSFGPPTTWPGRLRELQRQLGCSANSGRSRAAIWLIKRVLQKFGVRHWRRSRSPFVEPETTSEPALPQLTSPRQTGLGRRLLGPLLSGLEAAAGQRQRHQLMWDALLLNEKTGSSEVVSSAARSEHCEWTPYLAAYRVGHASAEATYCQWQREGLPVTTWPDLPPEVTLHKDRHAHAWLLRHSRLYLPVHQSMCLPKTGISLTA